MSSRLSQALATGALPLPAEGIIALFDPRDADAWADLPGARVEVVTSLAQIAAAARAQGLRVVTAPAGPYAAAIVVIERSRPASRLRIAQAVRSVVPGGPVIVDGQKTDGIDTAFKDVQARIAVPDSYSKSHGRLFWFTAQGGFDDWARLAEDWPEVEGFATAPGVFSADGIDPGSRLLAEHLPRLAGTGADLGAGWGYLARHVLASDKVTRLDLVECDTRALAAARLNLDDPRAVFHWSDARDWRPAAPLDFVVSNPPFHNGRAADPGLGQSFIAAAAAALSRDGTLWLVANRHLPYEATLETHFAQLTQHHAGSGFKVLEARAPRSATSRRT